MPGRIIPLALLALFTQALISSDAVSSEADQICGTVPQLDHIMVAVPDLEAAAGEISDATGVTPTFGGAHATGGTANFLARLGDCFYLEIIGVREGATELSPAAQSYQQLVSPRFLGFAVSTKEIQRMREITASHGRAYREYSTARQTPDGSALAWDLLDVPDFFGSGRRFFFIDQKEGAHASVSAPEGLRVKSLEISSPQASEMNEYLDAVGIDVEADLGTSMRLVVTLEGPRGEITYSSD